MNTRRCLALHDWCREQQYGECLAAAQSYFKGIELELSKGSFITTHWPKAKHVNAQGLVNASKNADGLTSLDGEWTSADASLGTASFSIQSDKLVPPLIFVSVPWQIDESSPLTELAKELVARVGSCYGYIFSWTREDDPSLYASGIVHALPGQNPYELPGSRDISRWGNEIMLISKGKRHVTQGMLRDVFDINLLNKMHLVRDVGGKSLRMRVEEEGWGEITQISPEEWQWTATETQRETARAVLRDQGAIV